MIPEEKERSGYSPEHAAKLAATLGDLRNAQVRVRLDLAALAEQLQVPRARIFATEGLGRRIQMIERTVLNVFDIYPPQRLTYLSSDECDDVGIQLQAFGIHVYALFDNIAWTSMLEAGGALPSLKVGGFKAECQAFMPGQLREYLQQARVRAWFKDYGKLYRDCTAHRIPPCLPARHFARGEGERWERLHEQSMQELLGATADKREQWGERLGRYEALEREKQALGSNSLVIAVSLTGEPAAPMVYLHPQMLSDWGLAHELLQTFASAMREHYGWQAPRIPPLRVA